MMETSTAAASASASEKKQKKRRTKVVRVDDRYIVDMLIKGLSRRPSDSLLEHDRLYCGGMVKADYDKKMAILQQYHDKGYAVVEVEVDDDDEENQTTSNSRGHLFIEVFRLVVVNQIRS